MNKKHALLLVGLVLASALILASNTASRSDGIDRGALPAEGCVCHGENGQGTPNPNVRVTISFDPNPGQVYKAGETYNLTLRAATDVPVPAGAGANRGGFNLRVSAGTLEVLPGDEERIKISATQREAHHTLKGDQTAQIEGDNTRVFHLRWKAPTPAAEIAEFNVWFNTVDGDTSADGDDHWNGASVVLLHKAGAAVGAAGEAVNPEELGVNWLAHWVGIASFAVVLITLLIYYFVLKFGESVHTTDHRDRKEK